MPTHIPIKNTNQRNQIKVIAETLITIPSDEKAKTKERKEWRQGVVTYLKAGEAYDAWVGPENRINIVELPT